MFTYSSSWLWLSVYCWWLLIQSKKNSYARCDQVASLLHTVVGKVTCFGLLFIYLSSQAASFGLVSINLVACFSCEIWQRCGRCCCCCCTKSVCSSEWTGGSCAVWPCSLHLSKPVAAAVWSFSSLNVRVSVGRFAIKFLLLLMWFSASLFTRPSFTAVVSRSRFFSFCLLFRTFFNLFFLTQ